MAQFLCIGKKLILAAVVIVMSATAVYEVITIAKVSAECRANRKIMMMQCVRLSKRKSKSFMNRATSLKTLTIKRSEDI